MTTINTHKNMHLFKLLFFSQASEVKLILFHSQEKTPEFNHSSVMGVTAHLILFSWQKPSFENPAKKK